VTLPETRSAAIDPGIDADAVLAGCVVDVAGVSIQLHASDARRADAVASLFRHAANGATPPVGTLHVGDAAVALPATDADVAGAHADLWRPTPGELRIRNPEGLTALATADEIVIGGDAAALARVFRYTCFLALTHLLAQHGRHLLHAGAVVIDDGAVVVLGDTGSGKSTLVFAAHRLGWPVLSDDVIAVRRVGDEVTAQGLPRPVSVPRDVTDAIPGGRPVPEDYRARTELPAGTLTRDARAVQAVVAMAGDDAAGSGDPVERLGSHDTLRAALRAGPSLSDPAQQPEVLAIAAALARRPAWRLRHGADTADAIADATRLLEAVRRRLGGEDPDRS
jgi:hypothetical protein